MSLLENTRETINSTVPKTRLEMADLRTPQPIQTTAPQDNGLQKLLIEEKALKNELNNLEQACSIDESSSRIQQFIEQNVDPLTHPEEGPIYQCFTGDTLILVNNNNEYKRIDEININDQVLSIDFKNNKNTNNNNNEYYKENKKVLSTVTKVYKSLINNITQLTFKYKTNNIDNNDNHITIKCTNNHPIWTINKGWCNITGKHTLCDHITHISSLTIGDECLLFDNNIVILTDIQILHFFNNPIYVYNLSVNNTQNYFANNILVHNKCCIIL